MKLLNQNGNGSGGYKLLLSVAGEGSGGRVVLIGGGNDPDQNCIKTPLFLN